jgi:hypothetical protein
MKPSSGSFWIVRSPPASKYSLGLPAVTALHQKDVLLLRSQVCRLFFFPDGSNHILYLFVQFRDLPCRAFHLKRVESAAWISHGSRWQSFVSDWSRRAAYCTPTPDHSPGYLDSFGIVSIHSSFHQDTGHSKATVQQSHLLTTRHDKGGRHWFHPRSSTWLSHSTWGTRSTNGSQARRTPAYDQFL